MKPRWSRQALAQTFKLLVACILVVEVAFADTAVLDASSAQYMVSAVLRRGDVGLTIRLVHGVIIGRSAEEAAGDFLKKVMVDYPGYSVMDFLTAPLRLQCSRSGVMSASLF